MNLPCYGVLETISDSAVVSGIGASYLCRVYVRESERIPCSHKQRFVIIGDRGSSFSLNNGAWNSISWAVC